MKSQKSVARNYLYNMTYQLLAVIVPLITTPYVSRVLEADGLGTYSYIQSIVTYFSLFSSMGLKVYGQLKIAACRDDRRTMSECFWGIFRAKLFLSIITGSVYAGLILLSKDNAAMYAAFSLCLVAQLLDISWLFQGLEEFRKIMIRDSVTKLVSVVLVLLLVRQKEDLVLYTVLVQGAVLIGNVSLWFYVYKVVDPLRGKKLGSFHHLGASLVYFIPTVATSVYTILDKSMLGWLGGSAFENGYYEQAHKIELILITVITSLSTVTLPRLKYMFTNGDSRGARMLMDQTIRLVLCLAFPMMIGIFAIAPDMIPWFLGNGYEKCIDLLRIFSVLMVVVGLDNIIGKQCLMATGKQKYYNLGVITGACVNVLLNLLLIPKLQSTGAAIASVVSELAILLVFLWHSREYVRIKSYIAPALKYLAGALLMGGVMCGVRQLTGGETFGVLTQFFTGVLTYGGYLLLTKDRTVLQFFKRGG